MEESNKASARRYYDEVLVGGDISVLRELFVPGSLLAGANEGFVVTAHSAFSDIRVSVDDLVAEGDKVAAHATFTAIHTGSLFGFPPTGKSVGMTLLALFTFEGGRIRTLVNVADMFGMLRGLGLIGPPQATAQQDETTPSFGARQRPQSPA